MMDQKNLAIGVLSVTAVVLLVGIIIVQSQPQSVYADGMSVSGGDYVMTVGKVQRRPIENPEELLYVIDTAEQKMIVYNFEGQQRKIVPVDHVDLKQLRRSAGSPAPKPGQRQPLPRRQPSPRGGSRPSP